MTGYTKLFGSIIASTIWREDNETRILWITMLAAADKNGVVEASVPGLADYARISVDATRKALEKLLSPDPDSRSKDYDGRRIEVIDGGWRLLNHRKYRDKLSAEDRAEYQRRYMQDYRRHGRDKTRGKPLVNSGKQKLAMLGHTDTDTDTDTKADRDRFVTESYHKDTRTVLHILNEATGRHFRETDSSLGPISCRLKESGVTLDGTTKMIHRQCKRWKGTQFEEFLRPTTLFGKKNFDSYYAAIDLPIQTSDGKTTQINRPNPRNVGIIKGPTDYSTLGAWKLKKQEEARAAAVARQMAEDGGQPPAATGA